MLLSAASIQSEHVVCNCVLLHTIPVVSQVQTIGNLVSLATANAKRRLPQNV